MKTFKEFLEEAYLVEMRKEDKVKGKQKTPLYVERTRTRVEPGSVRKTPEGKWKVTPGKRVQVTDKSPNPEAQLGRFKQGRRMPGESSHWYSTEGGTAGGPGFGYHPQPHGEGGRLRGVKRTQTIQQRRERSPEEGRTPAQKVSDKRKKAAYKGYNYKKGFNQ